MDEIARIRSAIREAARAAWTALRDERPAEDFYYFGLWTTALAHRPVPTACSIQGLHRAVDGARTQGLRLNEDDLRWRVNDSPYDQYGDELFAGLEPLFDAVGDAYDRPHKVNQALLDAMIGGLAELDAEGFFGTGTEREAVVLNVTLPAHELPADALESARRLNPPGALVRYAAELASAERG